MFFALQKNVKIIVFTTVIVFCFACATLAQVKDVGGWHDTTWGMSEEDVLKIYDGKAYRYQGSFEGPPGPIIRFLVKIDKFLIGHEIFTVRFGFSDKGKLSRIYLRAQNPSAYLYEQFGELLVRNMVNPPSTGDAVVVAY